jgi:hypothetical protein
LPFHRPSDFPEKSAEAVQHFLVQSCVPHHSTFADLALSYFKLRFHKSEDKGLRLQKL